MNATSKSVAVRQIFQKEKPLQDISLDEHKEFRSDLFSLISPLPKIRNLPLFAKLTRSVSEE